MAGGRRSTSSTPSRGATDPHTRAARLLVEDCPQLHRVWLAAGDPRIGKRARTSFEALARSIVYQQLAGAAASTIWKRVCQRAGTPVSANRLRALADQQLRDCGLSANKLAALRDLSARAPTLGLSHLHHLADDAIVERLVAVRGIGRWTAQMFLIFHLGRLDVWPTEDLGVREGYKRAFALSERPSSKELEQLGERFRPHRSLAAWYCWRAVEVM